MHAELSAPPSEPLDAELSLATCSVCLRILWGSNWIEAEQAIRELRSFERPAPPRLDPGLCGHCVRSLRLRRARAAEIPAVAVAA